MIQMSGGLMGQPGLHRQQAGLQPTNPRSLLAGAPQPHSFTGQNGQQRGILDDMMRQGGLGGPRDAPAAAKLKPPGAAGDGDAAAKAGVVDRAPIPDVQAQPLPPIEQPPAAGLAAPPPPVDPGALLPAAGEGAAALGVDGSAAGLMAGGAAAAEAGGAAAAEAGPLLLAALLARGGRVGGLGDDPVYRADGGDIPHLGRAPRGIGGPGSRGGISAFRHGGRGLVHGIGGGRRDTVKTFARRGSYVLPADVVSGAGEGNTMAGAAAIERRVANLGGAHLARGGAVGGGEDLVPVAFSGGEYVLWPEQVAELGGGDREAGSGRLDQFVQAVRQAATRTSAEAPPPA
jgi:hypothetical protein